MAELVHTELPSRFIGTQGRKSSIDSLIADSWVLVIGSSRSQASQGEEQCCWQHFEEKKGRNIGVRDRSGEGKKEML